MAGKHVGWQGGTAQFREGALSFATCLAERLAKRESEQASKHAGQPPAHACLCLPCAECWRCRAATGQTQHAGQEHRPPQLLQSTWHLISWWYVSPKSTCIAVHAHTSPCTRACRSSRWQPARTCTSLCAMAVLCACPLHVHSHHPATRSPTTLPARLPGNAQGCPRARRSTDTSLLCGHTIWHTVSGDLLGTQSIPLAALCFVPYLHPRGGATGGQLFQLTA